MSPEDVAKWKDIVADGILTRLTKGRISEGHKILSDTRALYYEPKKACKRGPNVQKGFTPDDYARFYAKCGSKKCYVACKSMQLLGLRVGEAAPLHKDQINRATRKLYLKTSKSGIFDVLDLHDEIYALLTTWIDEHAHEIDAHQGYLFYSDDPSNHTSPHITTDFLRVYIYKTLKRAGLDEPYGESTETYPGRHPRKLHRLSSHSNRHQFGTRVHLATGDLEITRRALRHRSLASTIHYTHLPPEHIWDAIARAMRPHDPHIRIIKKTPDPHIAQELHLDHT